MRKFAQLYPSIEQQPVAQLSDPEITKQPVSQLPSPEIMQQAIARLPWGHIIVLMQQVKDVEARE